MEAIKGLIAVFDKLMKMIIFLIKELVGTHLYDRSLGSHPLKTILLGINLNTSTPLREKRNI